MAIGESGPAVTVQSGRSCTLARESEGFNVFTRVLVPQKAGKNILLLFKHITNPDDVMTAFEPISLEVGNDS